MRRLLCDFAGGSDEQLPRCAAAAENRRTRTEKCWNGEFVIRKYRSAYERVMRRPAQARRRV